MTFLEELKKENEESFNKWFERWYKSKNFESKIKENNNKGYTSYWFRIDEVQDSYLRNRLFDKRTVIKIAEKIEGVKVTKFIEDGETILFGSIKRGWQKTYIIFDWELKGEDGCQTKN